MIMTVPVDTQSDVYTARFHFHLPSSHIQNVHFIYSSEHTCISPTIMSKFSKHYNTTFVKENPTQGGGQGPVVSGELQVPTEWKREISINYYGVCDEPVITSCGFIVSVHTPFIDVCIHYPWPSHHHRKQHSQ